MKSQLGAALLLPITKTRLGMKGWTLAVLLLALMAQAASADAIDGNRALALAALVGEHATQLSADDKRALARVFDGDLDVPDRTIAVRADRIVCRVSNVDISARSCELTFGAEKVVRAGRNAHELFATLVELGVP
jgi:hypothetical protein